MYKLIGSTIWEIPLCGKMSWGWCKILQVYQIVRPFIWCNLGNGANVSDWYDNWCSLGPLTDIISNHDIYGAGFRLYSKVNEVINAGQWRWPPKWDSKYPTIRHITIPILDNGSDRLVWKNADSKEEEFSVATVWNCIRPRVNEVDWYHVVLFSHQIPRHAIHLWLVIKRKLKTQDTLRQWDASSNTNLNLLQYPLCEMQPDSHDHLFFECVFSLQVWEHLKRMTNIPNRPRDLNSIVDFPILLARMRSARSVISKLVFAANFIWKMSNSEEPVNKGEMGESSKKLKRKYETMKGFKGDERVMFEFILRDFGEREIWDKVKEPLSPWLNENEYSICCENTTHMMNALKEARMESREMFLSIHHSLKMLLDIISKMNGKLEDEKIKINNKGKGKVNDF
ncbi:reverse transcriptase domain, reverse transcriptase zinc-binding domain protein [Tanacetum coccineum]